jgi:hypothetical protein
MSDNIEPVIEKKANAADGYESHLGPEKDFTTGPAVDLIGEGEELHLKQ